MSSIRSITASSPVPDDLAKRLGPSGVNEILLTLWQGYHDLVSDPAITITKNALEDDITLEWYGKIQQRWNNKNRATSLKINSIGPVHQYPDPTLKKKRGYEPKIDFCFRDWNTSNSYFGAECKNLYHKKKDKIKKAKIVRNSPDTQVEGFAVCGKDGKFFWADEAVIEGDTVVVSSKKVAEPVGIRFAWAQNPTMNLYSKDGFPAVPFRKNDIKGE